MKLTGILIGLIAMIASTSCCQQDCQPNEEKTNATIETIMSRRSIRKYKDLPVSRDTLKMIM